MAGCGLTWSTELATIGLLIVLINNKKKWLLEVLCLNYHGLTGEYQLGII